MRGHAAPGCRSAIVLVALVALLTRTVQAQALPDSGDGSRYPVHSWRVDGPLLAGGVTAVALGFLGGPAHEAVPPEGRDPSTIRWGLDRDVVGNRDEHADNLSNWTRNAIIFYPVAVAFATGPDGERLAAVRSRLGVWSETFLLARGTARLGKVQLGRARPYTYLPEADRPSAASYDTAADRAFESMPSGHSTTAWTAVGLAVTEHLLSRPDAGGWERFSVGFLGGALAGTVSRLRVEAGQHFPSDVLAGGALGITAGVTVPLLHRGGRPLPSRRAWLTALAGAATGALVGELAASSL